MWNPHCFVLAIIYSSLKAAKVKRSSSGSGESNNSGLHSSSWKDLPLPRLNMWLGQKGGDVLSVCNNLTSSQLSVSSSAHLWDCVMPAECTDKLGTPQRALEQKREINHGKVKRGKSFLWADRSVTNVDCTRLAEQTSVLGLALSHFFFFYLNLRFTCLVVLLGPHSRSLSLSLSCFHSPSLSVSVT